MKYLRDGVSFTTGFSMCSWARNVFPTSTDLLLNDGLSVPSSPKSTMSPLATMSRAVSAARSSTAATSCGLNVVDFDTRAQKFRKSTRCRPVGWATTTVFPACFPMLSFRSVRTN